MPFYIGENKIVDRYIGDKLVIAAYKGESKYFDAYSEITGTLPIIFKSRAAVALKNYRIYGISAGAGVETENLIDPEQFVPGRIDSGNIGNPADTTNISWNSATNKLEFATSKSWCGVITQLFENLRSGDTYTYSLEVDVTGSTRFAFYDENGVWLDADTAFSTLSGATRTFTITVPEGASKLRIATAISTAGEHYLLAPMLVKGSTAPATYIPYGYKIPILNTSAVVGKAKLGFYSTSGYNGISTRASTEPRYLDAGRYTVNRPTFGINGLYLKRIENEKEVGVSSIATSNSIRVEVAGYYTVQTNVDTGITDIMLTEIDNAKILATASNYDLFIGNSKLGEEEYLDYESGKVYKRTANFYDPNATDAINGFVKQRYLNPSGSSGSSPRWNISEYIEVNPNTDYTFVVYSAGHQPSVCEYDENKNYITGTSYNNVKTVSITTNAMTKYIRVSIYVPRSSEIMFVEGSTAPETYIPYLQPTDPPVPLPEILTYQGENTLSSTETLGEATIKGRINELPTQQSDN